MKKVLPFNDRLATKWATDVPTPFYVYDEAGIRKSARSMRSVFNWLNGYGRIHRNYFAVKALPNPHILEILRDEEMGADASSGAEIALAQAVGMKNPEIYFSGNNVSTNEYREAYQAGAIINLDDIAQIDVLQKALGGKFPDTISFRYNPGSKKRSGTNSIIGKPEDAKFGIPDDQLETAYKKALSLGVRHFGIHAMVASNELNAQQHIATAQLVFNKVAELSRAVSITFEFVNLGGGWGIPYYPEKKPIDYGELSRGIHQAYKTLVVDEHIAPFDVYTENGRHVTGPHGYLFSHVRSVKETFHRIVGLDATTISDLPRPALYDSYHEIRVVNGSASKQRMQRIVGSLCENNDYFTGKDTKDRMVPTLHEGDLIVITDAGAHAHAMTSNYNGKLRPAEYLCGEDKILKIIRRGETRQDLFATLNYPNLLK